MRKKGRVILALVLLCNVLVLIKKWNSLSLYFHHEPASISTPVFRDHNETGTRGYVIYECDGSMACGGWADRQKGILAAYLFSQMTRRQLGVRIIFPCAIEMKLQPNKVDWRVPEHVWRNPKSRNIRLIDNRATEYGKTLVYRDLDENYTEPVVKLTINMEWTQYLRQNKRFVSRSPLLSDEGISISALYRRALREVFTLTEHLQKQLSTFKAQIDNRKLACAHVRLGQGATIQGETKEVDDIGDEGLERLWDFLKQYANQGYAVFVPSDSLDVSMEARRRFPSNTVQFPGKVVHVDKSHGTAACDGLDKVLLDQEALSLCDVIVVSRSGLGLIGSWLRPREDNTFCLVNFTVLPCPRDNYEILFPNNDW